MINICKYCGEEYETCNSASKYCSLRCSSTAHRKTPANEADGKYRPTGCLKYCIYNQTYGCGYKSNEVLREPIKRWQECHYYRDTDHTETGHRRQDFDMMYGHMTRYKDSHSAVFVD